MMEIPDILARICADTKAETARRQAAMPDGALQRRIDAAEPPRGFAAALRRATMTGYGLIAEIKQVSPSGGLIRADFDPASLARAYRDGGATCLSVLTDPAWFKGEEAHLQAARAAVPLPVLRKDFMLESWQILESRAMGADCILLIMAALTDAQAATLERDAMQLGMDVLIEVHNQPELERALALKSPLLGVNNRNLKTLKTDLATTHDLAALVPESRLLVSESGISTPGQLVALARAGARCFLIGESLLRQADITAATKLLLEQQAANLLVNRGDSL